MPNINGKKYAYTKEGIAKYKKAKAKANKKMSPAQMKIAKKGGNPNKIDAEDFKKLRSA